MFSLLHFMKVCSTNVLCIRPAILPVYTLESWTHLHCCWSSWISFALYLLIITAEPGNSCISFSMLKTSQFKWQINVYNAHIMPFSILINLYHCQFHILLPFSFSNFFLSTYLLLSVYPSKNVMSFMCIYNVFRLLVSLCLVFNCYKYVLDTDRNDDKNYEDNPWHMHNRKKSDCFQIFVFNVWIAQWSDFGFALQWSPIRVPLRPGHWGEYSIVNFRATWD